VGGSIVLYGYALHHADDGSPVDVVPGDTLVVDLYWRADGAVAADHTVFVHLVGSAHNPRTKGPLWGQHDSPPANGHSPTSQWLQGDVLVDRHLVEVDQEAPPGQYRIEVGMYDRDGQRLPVASDGESLGDRVVLEPALSIGLR
jgi:hypothetical protein